MSSRFRVWERDLVRDHLPLTPNSPSFLSFFQGIWGRGPGGNLLFSRNLGVGVLDPCSWPGVSQATGKTSS